MCEFNNDEKKLLISLICEKQLKLTEHSVLPKEYYELEKLKIKIKGYDFYEEKI